MLWDHTDHPIVRLAKFAIDQLPTIGDVELATLKVHLVVEDALRYLLSARMGVDENAFVEKKIEFAVLADITLTGFNEAHLVGAVRALNAARNLVSHRVDATPFGEKLATFCMEAGYIVHETVKWPDDTGPQLQALREALERVAFRVFELAIQSEEAFKKPGA
jgi:hypothetical protein